jgi:C4-dicarboxylate-specific signal transduction histidine kinase
LRSLFQRSSSAKEPLRINDVVQEVIAITRGEVQKSGVVLLTEMGRDLPLVVGDRVQLQQLVLNLVLNAAEAMSAVQGRSREMVIKTRPGVGNEVEVAVRDAGVGLPPDGMEQIFEAFYTNKSGGMGMGLAISRSIAENHGGRLWAAANEGPGATFVVALPRLL